MKKGQAQEFAKRNRINPVWRAFKAKWDGREPREGTVEFEQFRLDADVAQRSSQAILDAIISEGQ